MGEAIVNEAAGVCPLPLEVQMLRLFELKKGLNFNSCMNS